MKPDVTCSHLYRVFLCPGSVRLSKVSPEPPPSEAASEGTMLHKCLSEPYDPNALNEEQKHCLEFVAIKTEELIKTVFGDKRPHVEREVEFTRNGQYWGRCDFLAHRVGTVAIIDAKFGTVPVERAEDNWQLRGYALGATNYIFTKEVYCAVLQPRVPKDLQCTIAKYGLEDIKMINELVDTQLKLADREDAALNPSPQACQYCPAKPICPAVKNFISELSVVHPSDIISPVSMSDYLTKARIVAKVIESIEYHALEMAKKNGGLPDYKLKEGRRIRKVTDANKCFNALSSRIDPLRFTKACKVQIGELEEVFKQATGLKGMEAKNELEHTLIDAGCLELTNGNQTLVKE